MDKRDKKVLSVPARLTFPQLTEHNVYSCPDEWPTHDPSVVLFAPRNGETMHKIYLIKERMLLKPQELNFHHATSQEAMDAVRGYVNSVRRIPGIIDGPGGYRFYFLTDLENGALPNLPKLEATGPIHCYLSLIDLLRNKTVRPLETCS